VTNSKVETRRAGAFVDRKQPSAVNELRALRLIQASIRCLLQEGAESRLMNNLCQVLVDVGDYRLVALHHANDDAAKSVTPIAIAGEGIDYLLDAHISWADDEQGRGPTGTAIRKGQTTVNRDFLDKPEMAPWRDAALANGLRSSLAVPLNIDGKIFGALTLYSGSPNVFSKSEIALTEEVAAVLVFGVSALRRRHAEQKAKEEAAARAAMIEGIQEAAPCGMILTGPNNQVMAFNQKYSKVWKVRPDVVAGMKDGDLLADYLSKRTLEPEAYRKLMAPSEQSREHKVIHHLIALSDGRTLDRYSTPAYAKDGAYMGRASFLRDVTEARRLELELKRINRGLIVLALLLFLGLVGLLLKPLLSHANLFSVDGSFPIRLVDRLSRPYSSIGMVESVDPVQLSYTLPGQAPDRGTGFMVSPCYALTAYHVLFGVLRSPSLRAPPEARISLGQDGQAFSYRRLPAKAVRWGDFLHDNSQDWVLIQVAGCPAKDPKLGWLSLAHDAALDMGRGRATTAGFDADFPPNQMVGQINCYLAHPTPGTFTLHHYCASRPGLSGAPIFTNGARGAQVLAIESGEQRPTSLVLNVAQFASRANVATYLPEVLAHADIGKLIADDIAKNGGPADAGPQVL
jgi:hypothetical protein